MPKFKHWENIGERKWNNENTDVWIEVREVRDDDWEVLKFYDRRGMDMGQTVSRHEKPTPAVNAAREFMKNFPFAGEKQHLMDRAGDMGYEDAEGVAKDSPEDDPSKIHSAMQDGFTQSAKWVNQKLPEFRQMAGCGDSGAGTYTDCEPEQDELVQALIDSYWEGAYNKIEEEA